jgi:hypothetical protein
MIHLSWEWKTIDLGPAEAERCPTCGTLQPFHLYLQYRCGALDWVFRVAEKKMYRKLCDVCRLGGELDPKQVEATLGRNPIPIFDRSGPFLLIGIFVAMLVLVVVKNL